MQAIFESLFDIAYLVIIILLGFILLRKGQTQILKNYGIMALVLGFGDAFHLVPRIFALLTDGFNDPTIIAAMGIGKLITSITMTVFYVLLYFIWRQIFDKKAPVLTGLVVLLAAIRIVLCLFPQNAWLSADQPLSWGIYRNIPFLLLGLLVIIAFYSQKKHSAYPPYRHMGLAIILSFGFYIPVVLWVDVIPVLGMLMIPKTIAYVWIVWMGFKEYKNRLSSQAS
ncbi:MAG: hypothetical protein AB1Z19_01130 [Eubacteriales bacterium]